MATYSKEIKGSDGSSSYDATVTVVDLTGATAKQHFARITSAPVFAKDYASVLVSFMMDSRYMPEMPQTFLTSLDEAKQLCHAVGMLYVKLYDQHTAEMREQLDAQRETRERAYELAHGLDVSGR